MTLYYPSGSKMLGILTQSIRFTIQDDYSVFVEITHRDALGSHED